MPPPKINDWHNYEQVTTSNHPIPSSSCKCWAIVWNSHISMVKLLRAQGWSSITPKPVDWVSLLQVHKPEHIPMPTHHIHISQTAATVFTPWQWNENWQTPWCPKGIGNPSQMLDVKVLLFGGFRHHIAMTKILLSKLSRNTTINDKLHRWFQAWNIFLKLRWFPQFPPKFSVHKNF